jgi:hypothetical protein
VVRLPKKYMKYNLKNYKKTRGFKILTFLSIVSFVIFLLVHFIDNLTFQIVCAFGFFSFFGVSIIKLFVEDNKDKLLSWIFKNPKKPKKIFEFGFFVFLFLASYFVSFAASYRGNYDYFNLLLYLFFMSFFFSVSFAFGYYHYIERLDIK